MIKIKEIEAGLPDIELLEELYARRDAISLQKRDVINQAIPKEVRELLDVIEAEYAPLENSVNDAVETMELALKEEAINKGETIKGGLFQVVFTKGGYSASAKDVQKLADRWEKTNPEFAAELRSILTVKKSSSSIKPRGN